MAAIRKQLSAKERLFCRLFAETGNPREAAARAGYSVFPERTGLKLLERARIREEIAGAAGEHKQQRTPAANGLYRLAFGSTADALKLLFRGESMEEAELESLDLFSVSEVKRQSGGGMEIKFFDRLKALEQLSQLEGGAERRETASFYEALEQSAAGLASGREDTPS